MIRHLKKKIINPFIKKDKRQLIKSSNPFQKRQELKSHANNVKKS